MSVAFFFFAKVGFLLDITESFHASKGSSQWKERDGMDGKWSFGKELSVCLFPRSTVLFFAFGELFGILKKLVVQDRVSCAVVVAVAGCRTKNE